MKCIWFISHLGRAFHSNDRSFVHVYEQKIIIVKFRTIKSFTIWLNPWAGKIERKILRSDWLVDQMRWIDGHIFSARNFPVGPAKNVL